MSGLRFYEVGFFEVGALREASKGNLLSAMRDSIEGRLHSSRKEAGRGEGAAHAADGKC